MKIFHAVASVKRKKSKKFRIQNMDGVWVSDQKEIVEVGVAFFQDQFHSVQQSYDFPLIQQLIPRLLTDGQTMMLTAMPDKDEIKRAILSMNLNGAAGPDDFNGQFYSRCWSIIKGDLVAAIQSFFNVKFSLNFG